MDDVILTFLGTGAAIARPNRFQSSVALKHPFGLVIFDVGEGAQYNLRKYEVPIRKEITICISHPHPDHYQGLAGLLASLSLLDRKEPVNLLVPQGFPDYVKLLLHATFVQPSYEINFVEMVDGDFFKGKGYLIKAIKALHFNNALSFLWMEDSRPGKWDKTLLEENNFSDKDKKLIREGKSVEKDGKVFTPEDIIGPPRLGRRIVYSGDTKYNPELIDLSKDADVLIHEATYPADMHTTAIEREHSCTTDGPNIGKLAGVDLVILTHIGTRFIKVKDELKIANEIHPTKIAKDGFQYVVKFKN